MTFGFNFDSKVSPAAERLGIERRCGWCGDVLEAAPEAVRVVLSPAQQLMLGRVLGEQQRAVWTMDHLPCACRLRLLRRMGRVSRLAGAWT